MRSKSEGSIGLAFVPIGRATRGNRTLIVATTTRSSTVELWPPCKPWQLIEPTASSDWRLEVAAGSTRAVNCDIGRIGLGSIKGLCVAEDKLR